MSFYTPTGINWDRKACENNWGFKYGSKFQQIDYTFLALAIQFLRTTSLLSLFGPYPQDSLRGLQDLPVWHAVYCLNAISTIFQLQKLQTCGWHHERNTPESLMWNPKMIVDLWRVKALCHPNRGSVNLTSDERIIIPIWSILVILSSYISYILVGYNML